LHTAAAAERHWAYPIRNAKGGQAVSKLSFEWLESDRLSLAAAVLVQVLFLNASEEIRKHPDEYNQLMLDIARSFSLQRLLKCTQIMGRSEKDDLSGAQIFYPCMQCADIFFLKARADLPPVHAMPRSF
jgi:tyrosyl-tRNA synthetase